MPDTTTARLCGTRVEAASTPPPKDHFEIIDLRGVDGSRRNAREAMTGGRQQESNLPGSV